MSTTPTDPMQARVLQALRDARQRIEALEAERAQSQSQSQSQAQPPATGTAAPVAPADHRIAIIGLAGRFPGADDAQAFWQLLREGRSGVRLLSDDELRAAGVPAERYSRPDYVRAHAGLHQPDGFDAAFFGYAPREAAVLDPQHRVFLETAWSALEDAAVDPTRLPESQRVGVFAGAALSRYLIELHGDAALRQAEDPVQVVVGNVLGLMPTRVSYHLGLTGPSVGVQTGCSTSLVAVHAASRSLLAGDCELALAGAVTIAALDATGHLHQPGSIASPDGQCRAFDAQGQGTVFGSGVGVVVLKRLSAALADGDPIRAVLLGSAVNNDGARKVGLLAPSVAGQAAVIREALAAAGVGAETLGAIEAHGTATPLGDPVEVAALHQALAPAFGGRRGVLPLGSVKSNLGHLDAAAGMAGLIKTVLALQHQALPASLGYDTPNPEIRFEQGPLQVNTALRPWPRQPGAPRRAGVSSFGMGGTNAHVVLEEAPLQPAAGGLPPRRWQVLPLATRTAHTLPLMAERLADSLANREAEAPTLADVACTLQMGRRAAPQRLAIVARSLDEALDLLRTPGDGPQRLASQGGPGTQSGAEPAVVFMFPGQGSQQPGMARALYEAEPIFRAALDEVLQRLEQRVSPGQDLQALRGLLLADAASATDPALAGQLRQTALAQPALFAMGVALARWWQRAGIQPAALLGHSIGEYAAACVAGVFSLDDALDLVLARGALMQACAPGRMLAVLAPEAALLPRLPAGVEIAAVNGPRQCVLAGPAVALEVLQSTLEAEGLVCHPLATSHAFHSAAMDAALPGFAQALARVQFNPPRLPLLGNLHGGWLTPEQATDPQYWLRQLRHAVRFGDALAALKTTAGDGAEHPLAGARPLLLELGPGSALSQLARPLGLAALPSLGQPAQAERHLAQAVAGLWVAGAPVDWAALQAGRAARRVSLPGTVFDRQRYRIAGMAAAAVDGVPALPNADVQASAHAGANTRADPISEDPAHWFWRPQWQAAPLLAPVDAAALAGQRWLVLGASADEAVAWQAALQAVGGAPQALRCEPLPTAEDPVAALRTLRQQLQSQGFEPTQLIATGPATALVPALALAQVWASTDAPATGAAAAPLTLTLLSRQGQAVLPGERPEPGAAAAWAAWQVAGQEAGQGTGPNGHTLQTRLLDLPAAVIVPAEPELLRLLASPWQADARVAALRGGERWLAHWAALPLPAAEAAEVPDPVYAVIAEPGEGLGLAWAQGLLQRPGARVLWLGRQALATPPAITGAGARFEALHGPVDDAAWLAAALQGAPQRLGLHGGEGRLQDRSQGRLQGIFHASAMGDQASCPLGLTGPAELALLHGAKWAAVQALAQAVDQLATPPGFVLLQSSLSAVAGGAGFAAYAAASAAQDALAWQRNGTPAGPTRWLSLNWDAVLQPGDEPVLGSRLLAAAFRPEQAWAATQRLLAQPRFTQVALCKRPLPARLREAFQPKAPGAAVAPNAKNQGNGQGNVQGHGRPVLDTPYVAPRTATESFVVAQLGELLGIADVGVDDDFFALGGQSLLAIQAVTRLRREYGVSLPMRALLFEARTAAGLARVIDAQRAEAVPTAVAAAPDEAAADPALAELLAQIERLSPEQAEDALRAL